MRNRYIFVENDNPKRSNNPERSFETLSELRYGNNNELQTIGAK